MLCLEAIYQSTKNGLLKYLPSYQIIEIDISSNLAKRIYRSFRSLMLEKSERYNYEFLYKRYGIFSYDLDIENTEEITNPFIIDTVTKIKLYAFNLYDLCLFAVYPDFDIDDLDLICYNAKDFIDNFPDIVNELIESNLARLIEIDDMEDFEGGLTVEEEKEIA